MIRRPHTFATALALTCSLSLGSLTMAGDSDWTMTTDTFASGGEMAGGDWGLSGSTGQAMTGPVAGGDWGIEGGFQLDVDVSPTCVGDFDGSGDVAASDLLVLLASWGSCPGCPADLDGSGDVAAADLLILLSAWGACP